MECQKTSDHTTYPVFHDVEPTEVRKQSGPVRKAFAKNTKKEAARKWRDAMKEASNLAGWELNATANGDESKLIQIIVDNIFKKLRSISSSIDGKLVGMEMRINEVLTSLKTCTEDVHVIGIKGMGGGGKTTLARAVYVHISSEFECKSFVENVREVSKTSLSGLKSLQKQVLSDVLNDQGITVSSVADGKDMMGKMLRSRKVLVVLDDVDHLDQLEALAGKPNWFKSGSMIIITTRDEQVLVSHGVSLILNVNLLSDKEALCLFSRYTFGRDIPIQGYEQLSGQVIRYAAGLPLTIRVLGSFLRGKKELEWKDGLERLKTIPQKEIQKVLEISFDDLENDYKEIFLDVACLLKGEQKYRAIQVFESCGFKAIIGLRVLEQKSLITISEYGSLGMHDHIEEMGKNIVFRLHPDDSCKHSRLWISGDIENILASDSAKVNEAIRCIKLSPLTLNLETVMRGLGNMKKLRLLYMCSGPNWKDNKVSQRFPNALKYLSWRGYPFSSLHETFQADNLVGLDMSFSIIENIRKGRTRKVLDKLRFLDLSYTPLSTLNLEVTPNLEILYLEHCKELIELYILDGCPKLQSLNLNYSKLKSLNFGPSPNLETLSLVGCCDLEEFCMPFRCTKLKSLSLDGSNLKNLCLGPTPNLEVLSLVRCCDLEELLPFRCTKLKSLSLNNSRLRNLNFGPTPDLETLSLVECDLEAFHVPFRCPNLKSLSLNGSKLRNLHLGLTPDLEMLSLAGCDLEELHVPFGCPKLISLNLNNSKLRNLNIRPTPKLENLSLAGCDLEELYVPFGCPKLKSLSLNSSWLKNFILGPTPDLEILSLIGYNLVELRMPSRCLSLRSLDLSHSKLRTLDIELTPNLERLDLKDCLNLTEINAPVGCLKKLIYLNLSGCGRFKSFLFNKQSKLLEVGSLSELHLIVKSKDIDPLHPVKDLSNILFTCLYKEDPAASSFGNLEKLISIGLSSCTNLKSFSRSICGLQCLKKLTLEGSVPEVSKDIHHLQCLEELCFSQAMIKHLPDGLCMLKQLKSLKLYSCWHLEKLPKDFGQLESLQELCLSRAKIKHLPDGLCMLKQLKSLKLEYCDDLEKLPKDFGQLESLQELCLSRAKIKHLPDGLCMLKQLKSLKLEYCDDLEKLPKDFGQLESLQELCLSRAKIKHLPDGLCMLKQLKSLKLEYCDHLEKLPKDFGQLESLQELCLSRAKIKHLPDGLCMLKQLKSLKLEYCDDLEKLPKDFGQLESLQELCLSRAKIKHLPDGLCMLKQLKSLKLEYCDHLEKLPKDFGQLESLQELCLSLRMIKHLPDGLCMLKQLKSLKLEYCDHLEKLPKDFGQLESLQELCLSLRMIKHLPDGLCMLKHLESLKLECCEDLEKLPKDFRQLESLQELCLFRAKIKHLQDGLCMLKQLKSLKLESCWDLKSLLEDFGELESLEKLIFSCTRISRLPDSICMLKHLKYLEIERLGLRQRELLLEDLGRLQCLEKLIFRRCQFIGGFPKNIFELKHQKYFHLLDCTLDDLPEELGHLKCLEELDITDTYITHLPQSIFQLKGLRIIGFERNLELCGLTPVKRTSDNGDCETFCYTVV